MNDLMSVSVGMLASVLLVGGVYAASVPKDEKSIAEAIDDCVRRTQTEDASTRMNLATAREFCTCYSRTIVMFMTDEEYTALLSGNELPSFRAKFERVSDACLQKLLNDHRR